jgi:hypothetical protein
MTNDHARFTAVAPSLFFALASMLSQTRATAFLPVSEKEQLSEHVKGVRRVLPPHSGLPPLLDLSKPSIGEGTAGRAWEEKFKNSLGLRAVTDPGVPTPTEATSVSLTTQEVVGPVYALPAETCEAVVIGKAISSAVHLARNHKFVYTTFSVKISQVLKTPRKYRIRDGETINAAEFGGSVLFPSGQMETFLVANRGFLELDKQFVLFIWRPIPSDATYVITEAYIVKDDVVFPTKTMTNESSYEGMPFEKFEAKVKNAIARNVDE